jgi:hypothetical protein
MDAHFIKPHRHQSVSFHYHYYSTTPQRFSRLQYRTSPYCSRLRILESSLDPALELDKATAVNFHFAPISSAVPSFDLYPHSTQHTTRLQNDKKNEFIKLVKDFFILDRVTAHGMSPFSYYCNDDDDDDNSCLHFFYIHIAAFRAPSITTTTTTTTTTTHQQYFTMFHSSSFYGI